MYPFVNLLSTIITLYSWVLIIYIILGWLFHFNVVNRYQPFISKVYEVLKRLVEPVLARIRSVVPLVGGVDLSPIVLFLVLYFIQDALWAYLV